MVHGVLRSLQPDGVHGKEERLVLQRAAETFWRARFRLLSLLGFVAYPYLRNTNNYLFKMLASTMSQIMRCKNIWKARGLLNFLGASQGKRAPRFEPAHRKRAGGF